MANRQARQSTIPVFQLYGEEQRWLTPDLVHCESIAARSRLHNWEIKPHRHYGLFQLLWLEQGVASLELDGQSGALAAGSVLLLPQQCIHGFRFSPDAEGQVITLAYSFFERLGDGLGQEFTAIPGPLICQPVAGAQQLLLSATLRALDQEYRGTARHRRVLLESLLASLLVWLIRHSGAFTARPVDESSRARKHLARFGELVEADFTGHHGLDYYAGKLGISAAHLNALCRQFASGSALDLIHARLTLEAKRQLVYTSMTIRGISDALGFSDPAYFTRFFKRQTQSPPKAFRLRARDLMQESQE
ncbi:MAG: helix-turn-helix domain-containing protein [Burkholderiaceae bacterium]